MMSYCHYSCEVHDRMEKTKAFDAEEVKHLQDVTDAINEKMDELSSQLEGNKNDLSEYKRYVWDNIYEMDMVEKAANADIVMWQEGSIARSEQELDSLRRLVVSPYFGRIDFTYDDDPEDMAENFYIGIRGFTPKGEIEQWIYDWRAPVSSMFYDCEEGPASYEAPQGTFEGIVRKKRQYKIEDGKFVFILDSSLKIDDEVLQEALSHSTDSKMKTIVSTIQKEQNKIIRNTADGILVVQGVAGSGKTSIALHRIAYILYAFRKEIKSNQVLVVSPNHIFSDYISNVLPELGETNIAEMKIDDLVHEELKNICKTEDKFVALENEILHPDEQKRNIVHFKSSMDFFHRIQSFFESFIDNYLVFKDVSVGGTTIPAAFIKKIFCREYPTKMPYFRRFEDIVERFFDEVPMDADKTVGKRDKNAFVEELKKQCLKKSSIFDIYSDFLTETSKEIGLDLSCGDKRKVHYEDAFPLVYFKFELAGYSAFNNIKHVVIDEMQDYSRIQFEILKHIFPCKMTILGDINQVMIPANENVLDVLGDVFEDASIIKINKTYRSTAEITRFASKIIGLDDIVVFERHGENPSIEQAKSVTQEIQEMADAIKQQQSRGRKHVAVICKTEKEAKKVHAKLQEVYGEEIALFTTDSARFDGGIVVIPSYLAKGLEFDAVLIPDVNSDNYATDIDKQILYVSCTRALHELCLFYTKDRSSLLNFMDS